MASAERPDNDSAPTAQHYLRSGAIAGVASTVVFTVIHHIIISNIWFSLPVMVIAGALCGLCLAWSYQLLIEVPSVSSWLSYNALYLAMLLLLGTASVLIFEPITTMTALIEANEPPNELIGDALPMTIAFTLTAAGLGTLIYGRDWRRFGAILLTATVLVALLGLNISVIGLVAIPRSSTYIVAELYALIILLDLAYIATFWAIERATFHVTTPVVHRQL